MEHENGQSVGEGGEGEEGCTTWHCSFVGVLRASGVVEGEDLVVMD
jgi:hypothetical protein